jgi:hypothetical protein
MKTLVCVSALLIIAILVCGCTTTSKKTVVAAAPPPNLLGNWYGNMTGYIEDEGYNDYSGDIMIMRVTEQKDRIFSGDFFFSNQSGYVETVAFAGVISPDGTTLTMVEHGGGYSFGSLIASDEIELDYANDAKPFEVAIDVLKKS